MGRNQNFQSINFDAWAVAWNQHCANIESGEVEWEAVYRKTSNQLQAYHQAFLERANARLTMMSSSRADGILRASLRQGEAGAASSVDVAAPLPVPRSATVAGGGAAAGPGSFSDDDSEMVDVGGEDDLGGGGDGFGGVGVEAQAQSIGQKRKGPPREPQICKTCGHRRQQGSYKSAHPHPRGGGGPPCNVPPEEYRPASQRTGRIKLGVRLWPRCDCPKCRSADG